MASDVLELWRDGREEHRKWRVGQNQLMGRGGCAAQAEGDSISSHWKSSKRGPPAIISEFISVTTHLYPSYSSPGEPGFLTDMFNMIKNKKEKELPKYRSPLGAGYFLGGDVMRWSFPGWFIFAVSPARPPDLSVVVLQQMGFRRTWRPVRAQIPWTSPRISISVGLGWGPRTCISYRATHAAASDHTLRNCGFPREEQGAGQLRFPALALHCTPSATSPWEALTWFPLHVSVRNSRI